LFLQDEMIEAEIEDTLTLEEQKEVERRVARFYDDYHRAPVNVRLYREQHVEYLLKGLKGMSSSYQTLDASRPWLCYWILHALELLDALPIENELNNVAKFLEKCQNPNGGFGGGPGQLSHLAPTYAATNALIICGTDYAFKVFDRAKMYQFLMQLKQKDGGFIMHVGGESDVRGTYCAFSVASVLNIMTPELKNRTGEYIARCQTYEGGMGGEPGNEAHGGYTFCAVAALSIINELHLIDINRLFAWCAQKQMDYEGGFQGRTNKLVDSCYSFWQGALFPLIHRVIKYEANENERWLFRQQNLQEYVLICCQDKNGGLIDKPGKSRDFYHTCYALSGVSISQHNYNSVTPLDTVKLPIVVGDSNNLLKMTDTVWNVDPLKLKKAFQYFEGVVDST